MLVENWLKIVRVFIPHVYLAPRWGWSHVTISEKTSLQSSRLSLTTGLSQWKKTVMTY